MSTVRALVVHPDGSPEVVSTEPTLENLQSLVGGDIEPITPVDGPLRNWHAYADEDGKYKNRSYNRNATVLLGRLGWLGGVFGGDFVVGTVVLLGDAGSEEADLPDDVLDAAKDFYREQGVNL